LRRVRFFLHEPLCLRMHYDLAVIGGGFYGCAIAAHAAEQNRSVTLLERADSLLSRASFSNQARIHNGYHYPRSFTTAWRSHENYRRFLEEFADCVQDEMLGLYAIARSGSQTTARHFERLCQMASAPVRPARAPFRALFSKRMVDAVFEVDEVAFDATLLRRHLEGRLRAGGVEVRLGERVTRMSSSAAGVSVETESGLAVTADRAVNCTYSGLNQMEQPAGSRVPGLKHELTEVTLVSVPPELEGLGITVMDGPFFSLFPFPPRRLHTLTHVRHTPHAAWAETNGSSPDPYEVLTGAPRASRFPAMVRDASRFLPALADVEQRDSLFEIKTVPASRELDDARPILLQRDEGGRILSVLGSKIDNIYDVVPEIDGFLSRTE
jgi:glycine/D-amino acid oxidase-like deaminating enzyme